MKLYLILVLFLLQTSISFSQTATDTSYVVFPNYVAKEIAKELVEKDFLEKEVVIYRRTLSFYKLTIITNEEIINNLKKELVNYKISEKLKSDLYLKETSMLQKELEEEKRKFKVYRQLSYVGVFIVTVLSLVN